MTRFSFRASVGIGMPTYEKRRFYISALKALQHKSLRHRVKGLYLMMYEKGYFKPVK